MAGIYSKIIPCCTLPHSNDMRMGHGRRNFAGEWGNNTVWSIHLDAKLLASIYGVIYSFNLAKRKTEICISNCLQEK